MVGNGNFTIPLSVTTAADASTGVAACNYSGISFDDNVCTIRLVAAANAGSIVSADRSDFAASDCDMRGVLQMSTTNTGTVIFTLCKESALAAVLGFLIVFDCQCARSITVVFLKTGVIVTTLQDVVSVQFDFRIAIALYRESSFVVFIVILTAVNIHIVQHKRKSLLGIVDKVVDNGNDVFGRRCGGACAACAAVVCLCCGGSGQRGGRGNGRLIFLLLLLFLLCGRLLRGLGGFCLCLGRLRGHFLFGWLLLLLLLFFLFLFGGLLLRGTLFALPGGCGFLLRCSVPGGILTLGRFRLVHCGGVAPVCFLRGGGSADLGAVVPFVLTAGSAPDDDAVKCVGVGFITLIDGDYTGIADVNIHTALIDVVGGRECGGRNGCHNGQHRCCRKHPQCKILRSHKQSSQKLHGVDP